MCFIGVFEWDIDTLGRLGATTNQLYRFVLTDIDLNKNDQSYCVLRYFLSISQQKIKFFF